jgi:hypothetical protein
VADDPGLRQHSERLRRLLRRLSALLDETDSALEAAASEAPTAGGLRRLDRLRGELAESVEGFLEQNTAFLDYTREQVRKIEESKRQTAMPKQRTTPARDHAQIQALSEQLALELRLERVDRAIKEVLDFLSDTEFFAANASVGRRRRLRALQNAIEKALPK